MGVPGFLRENLVHRERPKTKIINQHILSIVYDFIKYRPNATEIARDKSSNEGCTDAYFMHPTENGTLAEWESWIEKAFYLPTLWFVLNFCDNGLAIIVLLLTLSFLALPVD